MYSRAGKRLLDLLLSSLGLLALSPLFLLIPLIIKLGSAGPAYFVQRRMGRDGRGFPLMKFRSMARAPEREAAGFEPGASARVTKVGRWLRRSKLDEIPQLVNVFLGDMSFVGPRPEVEKYRDIYAGKYADVLSVRPGITDLASIKYRHEEDILARSEDPEKTYREVILPDKLELALEYLRPGVTLARDLRIIFQTLASVCPGRAR